MFLDIPFYRTGGYITYPKSNNEVRIVSLATHKTASWQGNRVAILASPLNLRCAC